MKKGLLYAILASVLWAIVNPFIKQGLSYDFTPMNFAGLRFTSVGVLLFAYTWHKGMWQEIKQHRKLFLNLIFINMLMGYTAFYFGVDFVSGAISSIIMGMTPLINVLLAHLLASNDKLNGYKIVSLIISLAGLLLIVGMGSDGEPLDWKGITGIILLLLSIIFQGYSAISVSEEKGKVNPIFLNAVQMFFGGALIYIIGLGTEGYHSFIGKPAGFYISLGILVFISVCLQLLVYGVAKQRRKSQRHQHVPPYQPDSRSCIKLDNACGRIPHIQYSSGNADYCQFVGYLF